MGWQRQQRKCLWEGGVEADGLCRAGAMPACLPACRWPSLSAASRPSASPAKVGAPINQPVIHHGAACVAMLRPSRSRPPASHAAYSLTCVSPPAPRGGGAAELKDIDFVQKVLARIKERNLPAPCPIEQRWGGTRPLTSHQ